MRGRKPKPTQLRVIEGNAGKRPLPANEAQVPPALPEPPDHLCADALEEWHRITPGLYAVGLLGSVDRSALAAYCQAYGRWVTAERLLKQIAADGHPTHGLMIRTGNGNAYQNPLVGTANKAASDMVRYAAEFGMTPSARTRIAAARGDADKSDPAAKYLS